MSDADYNWRNLTPAEISRLSVLGRRMFLNEKIGFEQHRNFTIHLWNYDKFAWELGPRFFKIGSPIKFDPFESCSVSNCRVTTKNKDIMDADAVLFHLHLIAGPPAEVRRAPGQLWVWFGDESPYNVLISTNDRNLIHYSGFFNWSMTYRMDSNVPVPYGRAVPLPKDQYLDEIEDYHKLKKKNIALMGWNCGGLNGRYKYLAEMQKYIEIDVYGRCGTLKCEGHYYENCNKLDDYKFYLAFESLNCDEYVTEKAWWNALNKSAVPVVMGAPKHSYQKLLPPNSFIHIDDFKGPEELTQYIKYLLDHPAEYNKYHDWRKRYRVFNEHGYSGAPTRQLCRLCEALNYNNKTNQRADLENYFDHKRQCHDT
ncbi:hypothetical protein HAZT_HAZT003795 [Hyalella azteca]|uniref:Fucosyltransferase n=1 Tax=Hyalella azteca TaxID=294128 RepID=A0A6A0H2V2_HYAAZ|nr:glycoprotein 3-alpha-L-fucosyltransferase A [Hyalella azteca]KAA0197670.1 hypothetical protein HAZT_HAZT003795 [Hyalella azteca]